MSPMRSLWPMPGNPWPHEMTIAVEDNQATLLEMLWVRDAWGLSVSVDAPGPLIDSPKPEAPEARAAQDVTVWEHAWPQLWTGAVAHAAEEQSPLLLERLMRPDLDPGERAELLQQLTGPTWGDRFDDAGLGDAFQAWQSRHTGRLIDRMHARHKANENPERRSLDALIPAWKRGLTRIVVIPCEGSFTRTIGPRALLVTAQTRDDPERYREALAEFTA